MDINTGLIMIGAGLAVGLAGLGVGVGEGHAVSGALQAIGRNPEAESSIKSTMILGLAMNESSAIYGLIVAILLMFVVGA